MDDSETSSSASDASSSSSSSTSGAESSTASSHSPGESSDSGTSSTGGLICSEINPQFTCEPIDCERPIFSTCGGAGMFTEQGCMRAWCHGDDECGEGEVCLQVNDCDPGGGGCFTLTSCSMEDGKCSCGAIGGCPDPPPENPGGWCIPAEEMPC
jgi:hypothetical protein